MKKASDTANISGPKINLALPHDKEEKESEKTLHIHPENRKQFFA